jgi:hypothetical protein
MKEVVKGGTPLRDGQQFTKSVLKAQNARVELIRLEREASSLWRKAVKAAQQEYKHVFNKQEPSDKPKAKRKNTVEETVVNKDRIDPSALREMCKILYSQPSAPASQLKVTKSPSL